MNISTADQAVIVRAPTMHPEIFAKDVSFSPDAIQAGDILPGAGYDEKSRSLDGKSRLNQMAVPAAPQLNAPKTIPGGKEAQQLSNDLGQLGEVRLAIDEDKLLNFVMQAIDDTYTKPLSEVARIYTKSVDDRIIGLLREISNNQTASKVLRCKKRTEALTTYSQTVDAKVAAIHAQGVKGLSGSLGAAFGSLAIAGGGLVVQGRATTIKTDVVEGKEKINLQKQLLRDESRAHHELEQKLKGGVMGNPRRDAYEKRIAKVDGDIVKVNEEILDIKNEIRHFKQGANSMYDLGNSRPQSWRVDSDDFLLPDLPGLPSQSRNNNVTSTSGNANINPTLRREAELDSLLPSRANRGNRLRLTDDELEQLDLNELRINTLKQDKAELQRKKANLERDKPNKIGQIEEEHGDIVSLINQEKAANDGVNMRHDLVNKMDLEMEGQTIVAERQHTIGWTIVNLQTMSAAVHSGFEIQQQDERGRETAKDADINASQGEVQIHDQGINHDQTASDGVNNALDGDLSSYNNSLRAARIT